MIHALIYGLTQGGFLLLLFAMARHQQEWLRRKLTPHSAKRLKAAGFGLLLLAFAVAGSGLGWGYGTVVWIGWLTIAAALTVTLNTNRERILARIRA